MRRKSLRSRKRNSNWPVAEVGRINTALHTLELVAQPKLQKEFEALVSEEREAEAVITGRAYQHLGMIVPPRPPL